MPSLIHEKPALESGAKLPLTPRVSQWKKFAVQSFQLLTVLIICILGLELAFGMAGLWEQDHLIPNRENGISIMPGRKITFRNEGFSRRTFNSFGMADREVSLAKPAGAYRIAVIGDSMVEALQVDLSKTMCSQLQEKLNASGANGKVEVLNFGVSSSNAGHLYLRLKNNVMRFKPDLVIVYVRDHATADLSLPLNMRFPIAARPYFFVANNGELFESRLLFDSWWNSKEARTLRAAQWLRMHSHVWSCFWNIQSRFVSGLNDLKIEFASKTKDLFQTITLSKPNAGTQTKDLTKPKAPVDARFDVGQIKPVRFYFAVLERLLASMNDECTRNHCKFAVAYIGTPDLPGQEEHKLLKQSMEARGIHLMDFTDQFQASKKQTRLFYVEPGHFNVAGNELFADLLSKHLGSNHELMAR